MNYTWIDVINYALGILAIFGIAYIISYLNSL